jgi:hypothetical protein
MELQSKKTQVSCVHNLKKHGIMVDDVMLSVIYAERRKEALYAECRYAKCHAECCSCEKVCGR